MIKLSINVEQIVKEWLFSGSKGKMLDLTLIPRQSQYSDYMVVQDPPKSVRAKDPKARGPILGNGKNFGRRDEDQRAPASAPNQDADLDDIPF